MHYWRTFVDTNWIYMEGESNDTRHRVLLVFALLFSGLGFLSVPRKRPKDLLKQSSSSASQASKKRKGTLKVENGSLHFVRGKQTPSKRHSIQDVYRRWIPRRQSARQLE